MIFTHEQIKRLPGSTVRLRNGDICTMGEQYEMLSGYTIFRCDKNGTEGKDGAVCYAQTQKGLPAILDIVEVIKWADAVDDETEMEDPVNHPTHYTSHPSSIEVIQITEHMGFCLGNAIKYILRADHKGNAIQDLKKAAWYINREIERRAK